MSSNYETLKIEKEGAVDWLTLDRPESRNAITLTMATELRDYFGGLFEDESVRIVVMRGAGKSFCAGLDLTDVATVTENAASSYMFERAALLALLAEGGLPAGRWVGLWHAHPGDPAGEPPSGEDLDVARTRGRFVTIVLRRDGYDLYDLRADRGMKWESLEPDLEARPEDWKPPAAYSQETGPSSPPP